ncbi:unnamed protein product [Protopolystoma xenopodis]|uniref:START domain-containing protein n=1 Tax=Protopolystoma xenopodis TaxID=117903 RepID=A0A448WJ58_9PLAT|nr:unnamed protein product [Protopolystoma xenopodis]
MQFYKVGEVRPPLLSDFEYFTQLVNSEDGGWKQHYNKHHTVVSSRCQNNSEIKLIRLKCVLSDVSASVLYDVIHDPKYRSDWDKIMIEGYSIGQVSPDSDIGYYSLKAPLAFANRDYVTQRAWVAAQDVYIIFNHSVFHKDIPPKKSFVRGISYITGYFIRAIDSSSCEMIYITQNDPRGDNLSYFTELLSNLFIV